MTKIERKALRIAEKSARVLDLLDLARVMDLLDSRIAILEWELKRAQLKIKALRKARRAPGKRTP